ncbi:MAG TPA: hypothetical protein VEQ41_01585, partial [Solirubrobacterales bacterium]|nr:hypothetical protein [Solirubrobacterales bacterium]
MKRIPLTVLTVLALMVASPAAAQAEFGFADVNTGLPNDPDIPAFPGQKAVYTGTCDLGAGSTENGGVGAAPALRAHCMDVGGTSLGAPPPADVPWPAGEEPAWRLDPVTQAGAHPDGTAAFWFNYELGATSDENVKNIIVKLPPGVVGNPEAVQKCDALSAQAVPPACDARAQVGISTIGFPLGNPGGDAQGLKTYPVYGIEARDTVTAEFLIGDVAGYFNVPITARGRTNGDYGVDTLALLIPQFTSLGGQSFTFWGVPWSETHDRFRIDGLSHSIGNGSAALLNGVPPEHQRPYDPSWGPIKPFFTNPTSCVGAPLPLQIDMDSWQNPVSNGGNYVSAVVPTDPITGCDEVQFDPSITLKPTVDVSDSPSGLEVKLTVPQNNDPPSEALGNPNIAFDPSEDTGAPAFWKTPAGRATAHLKDTTVQLPQGTSFNPAAANGVEGCTTSQIGLTALSPRITFNNDPHNCPDNSKVGTLEIVSPLLPDPLEGAVYAAPQHDNPFPGSLTAIYMVSQDEERGLSIKLPGKVDLDPDTGQISTTFLDNPQLPFDTFELHFKSGPRAPLNTPPVCGQFRNQISLIPWSFPHSGPEPAIQDPFDIASMPNGLHCVTEPEDRVFGPGFEAGSTN